ncbi:hypothetical protein [Mycoplasma seminis]|uniref:Uncharacterized protein n=1 Tax=Mycoplasma seminis TaxID=512749 RepID=A0ABY9HD98_9MOLU|nr:hypothetical protein [Mycoplasma seminis]WLP85653.1 hypothetical protein Q8852_00630 [Mycoplasma seminis]
MYKTIQNKANYQNTVIGTYNEFIEFTNQVIKEIFIFPKLKQPQKEAFQKLTQVFLRSIMYIPVLKTRDELLEHKALVDISNIDPIYFEQYNKFVDDSGLFTSIRDLNVQLVNLIIDDIQSDEAYSAFRNNIVEYQAQIEGDDCSHPASLTSDTRELYEIFNTFIYLYLLGKNEQLCLDLSPFVMYEVFNNASVNITKQDGEIKKENWFQFSRVQYHKFSVEKMKKYISQGLKIYLNSVEKE